MADEWPTHGLTDWTEGDTAYLSVVFSWRLPDAYQRAVWYRELGYRVRAGGPAVTLNPDYLATLPLLRLRPRIQAGPGVESLRGLSGLHRATRSAGSRRGQSTGAGGIG